MDAAQARLLIQQHHRAVLITFRRDGRPQPTPVLCGLDGDGRVVVSTTERTAKVRNLRRDPRVSACLMNEGFFGAWASVEGTADIVPLPEAMEGLVDLYRSISGEHPDWDEYRRAMVEQRRVLLRFPIERAGPS